METDARENGEEGTRRKARAERILDAALELLARWGYRKTTLDDISRQASVAKSTIYLHWKTREELFEALILREWLAVLTELKQSFANGSTNAGLSSLIGHFLTIALGNPLFRAILLRDRETLGDLVHSGVGQHITRLRLEITQSYIVQLRAKGMIRTDMGVEAQMKMLAAISLGFLLADRFLPSEYSFLPEEIAEALAQTLRRTFEPEEAPAPTAVAEVTHHLAQLLDQLGNALEHRYKELT